jgi:hypothetical protein
MALRTNENMTCVHGDGREEKRTMGPTTFTAKATAVEYRIDDKMPQCLRTKTKTLELCEALWHWEHHSETTRKHKTGKV